MEKQFVTMEYHADHVSNMGFGSECAELRAANTVCIGLCHTMNINNISCMPLVEGEDLKETNFICHKLMIKVKAIHEF